MVMNLSKQVKFTNLMTSSGSTAGSTSVTCQNMVDMKGFDSISLIATLGEAVATGSAVLIPMFGNTSGSLANSSGTTAVCAGFDSCTTEHNESLLVVDMVNAGKRWVGAAIRKGTASVTVKSVIAIQYNHSGYEPVTNQVVGSSGSGRYLPSSVAFSMNTT